MQRTMLGRKRGMKQLYFNFQIVKKKIIQENRSRERRRERRKGREGKKEKGEAESFSKRGKEKIKSNVYKGVLCFHSHF